MSSHVVQRLGDGLADQDLAARGQRGDPCGVGHVASEDVVVAVHHVAVVDADPDQDRGRVLAAAAVEGLLDRDGAADRLLGRGERRHEPVALGLDHLPLVPLDGGAHHRVVASQQPHPVLVAQPFVELGRTLDVGEEDRHPAVRPGQPHQRRSLHLRPAGEVVDRAPDRTAQTLLADPVDGLPDRLDRLVRRGDQAARRSSRRAGERASSSSARRRRWVRRPTSQRVPAVISRPVSSASATTNSTSAVVPTGHMVAATTGCGPWSTG